MEAASALIGVSDIERWRKMARELAVIEYRP
jgi:hypothetical protein